MYGKLDFLHAAFGLVPPELDGYESTADSPAFDILPSADPNFILMTCLSKHTYLYQGNLADGSRKAKRVHVPTFLDMSLNIPNIEEQYRIVLFLHTIDKLIAAAKKKADLLKLKKKYYLQAIFSQRLRFKGFTKPWQQRKLEELCIRVGSGGTPSVQHPEYYNGKIPFLGISDLSGRAVSATQKKITQRGLDNSAAWLVPKGSITLAMYASVGKVAILDIELATSQAFFNMVIPEETCIRDFLFSRLEKADICHEWLPLISTGTQPNLNAAKLKDWELKVPSTQERKTIGEFFHALDDLAAALARKIELLERRKTAYLQRLFV